MPELFTPLELGDLDLPNRIIMAPLTRCRAGEGRIPNSLMADYYVQRASAGLILTEATSVTPMGVGYPDTPGIWSDEQVEGWRQVTSAIHKAGGRIFMQLWHVGRVSHPSYLNGALPVAPSAIAPEGHVSLVRPKAEYVTPRALELSEIPAIVEAYRKGAENAKAAGFDGVEIHGANGYLLDQFLQDRRTSAPTPMAAPSRTAPGCCWRLPTPPSAFGAGPGRHASGAARRFAFHGRQRSESDIWLCRARAWQAQDRLHLHARICGRWLAQPASQGGVRRRLDRQ